LLTYAEWYPEIAGPSSKSSQKAEEVAKKAITVRDLSNAAAIG